MRIFLDTNVLVSAYTAHGISADLVRFVLAEHELLTGEVNIEELRRVLRVQFRASVEKVRLVEAELRDQTVVPRPSRPWSIPVRDPDDQWVLASAIAAGADLLVTGDQDLLDVADQAPVPILDPRRCWARLHGSL